MKNLLLKNDRVPALSDSILASSSPYFKKVAWTIDYLTPWSTLPINPDLSIVVFLHIPLLNFGCAAARNF